MLSSRKFWDRERMRIMDAVSSGVPGGYSGKVLLAVDTSGLGRCLWRRYLPELLLRDASFGAGCGPCTRGELRRLVGFSSQNIVESSMYSSFMSSSIFKAMVKVGWQSGPEEKVL